MTETFVIALTTFMATIGPIDVAAMFAAMTPGAQAAERRAMATRGIAIASGILLLFAFAGQPLLQALGISLPALRVAGGILLLLIGIDMVFARTSGGVSTTDDERAEAATREDISVFPLATPLIAGPGTMGALILLMADTEGDLSQQAIVIGTLLGVLMVTWLLLLGAAGVSRVLGVTGLHVVTRVFGVLLTALAVQFMFDGIAGSGLLPTG
ncbi:MAG: NAAT family transporter [Gemmatimonadetes bacterium]|jgi:multiple antibiotic resistance protein|nr:NAAT family transporter [Gemmatimonadota bacterium]MBT6146137.1 NAAT family transporter [Gemmatimonadota bacterium]MBT7860874.1 NAAT family transporter [Gemmatimonadota bacterium]